MQAKTILRILGIFLMLLSGTMLPPIAVSLWYDDGQIPYFSLSLAITFSIGCALWLPVRRYRQELRNRDGFLIVAMFWGVLGMLAALPFMFSLHISFTDAVFEAISGFTTTGATVIVGLDQLPKSILYYRQQLHFFGGMGIVVLAVAIFPMIGVGGMQLYRAETPGPMKEDKLTPRIAHTARALWLIYLGLTGACALAFWMAGMTPFDAIGHSFSTIATGGFSTHDASFAYFKSPLIEAIAVVFMLVGGINFAVHFIAWQGRSIQSYLRDAEARSFLMVTGALCALVAAVLVLTGYYPDVLDAVRQAVFQVVSIITTTGFVTADFSTWPLFLPILMMVISFVGGSAGSTAGGIKVIRVMLLYRQGMREIGRLIHPSAVIPVKFGGKILSDSVIESVWGFFFLYMLSTVVLTLLMMSTGLDAVSAFAAIASCLNVTGPGLGAVASNFTTVTPFGKWVSIFAMLLGRLEIFTVFVLLTPSFWRR